MVIYYLKLIISAKMIFQFSQEVKTYHPKIDLHQIKKGSIDYHIDANKGEIKGYLYLEEFFGFCKSFKKVTKNLVFHLMLETNDLQVFIYTSMADDLKKLLINCTCFYQI